MHTVMFEDKKDCAGILAEDACGEHLANIPKEKGEDFCQRIKAKLKFTSFKDSCPSLAPYCEPEAEKAPDTAGGGAIPPPADPGRDGLEEGFGGGPPAGRPPVRPPASPRLVYLKHVPGGGEPVREFTVWLDRTGCPVPIAANNKPADPAAAIHVVRGRIARSDGHVRIEAEARELKGGRKRGPFLEYVAGEDTAAVAAATRVVLRQLDLVCSR